MTPKQLADIAKACGATTYTNRALPGEPAFAFGNEAWEKFCGALSAQRAAPTRFTEKRIASAGGQIAAMQSHGWHDDAEVLRTGLEALKAQRTEPISQDSDHYAGAKAAYVGRPILHGESVWLDPSFELFGIFGMFAGAESGPVRSEWDPETGFHSYSVPEKGETDHETVTKRLEWLIANSQVE